MTKSVGLETMSELGRGDVAGEIARDVFVSSQLCNTFSISFSSPIAVATPPRRYQSERDMSRKTHHLHPTASYLAGNMDKICAAFSSPNLVT